MGSLFGSSGPSARDIARQEEKARVAEMERLRIAEQKLRRRESKETMQGQGIATPDNILLGSDTAEESVGNEEAMGTLAKPVDVSDELTVDPKYKDAIANLRKNGLQF